MGNVVTCYPRYKKCGSAELSGYTVFQDRVNGKQFLGRVLQQEAIHMESLDWITYVKHFALLPSNFRLYSDGDCISISTSCTDVKAIYPGIISKISSTEITRTCFNLISGMEFLFRHGRFLKQLSVRHLVYDTKHGGRVGYLEDLISTAEMEGEFLPSALNWMYSPPETQEKGLFDESSLVYYLGCLFTHLLTGSPHYRTQSERSQFLSGFSIKNALKELLWEMTQPLSHKRIKMNALLVRLRKEAGISKNTRLDVRLFHHKNNRLPLPEDGHTSLATLFQTGPGREGLLWRNRTLEWAKEQNYLLLHLWHEEPMTSPFQSINCLIDLIRGDFLKELGFVDQFQSLPHLSNWQTNEEIESYWKPLVGELKRALFGNIYTGVVIFIENFHFVDHDSIGAFSLLINWLKDQKIIFVASISSFLHKNVKKMVNNTPLAFQLIKPAALTLEDFEYLTDAFQGQKKYYLSLYQKTQGNQSLLLNELSSKGKGGQFLEDFWRQLTPACQRLFSLLSCSFFPMALSDIEEFIPRSEFPEQETLDKMGFIERDSIHGLFIKIPMVRQFCLDRLPEDTRLQIWKRILQLESTGGFQKYCVSALTGETDQSLFSHAVNDVLSKSWDLWYYATIPLGQGKDSSYQNRNHITKSFTMIGNMMQGIPVERSLPAELNFFVPYNKGIRALNKGLFDHALKHFVKASSQRKIPVLLKAACLVKALYCHSMLPNRTGSSILIRKYTELNWPDGSQSVRHALSACVLALGIENDRLKQITAGRLKHWPMAQEAWRKHDFNSCLLHAERVIQNQSRWFGYREWGNVYKLYGNALFRNNHPHMAARAYQKARMYFRKCHDEHDLWSVSFNLASTEKLAGNMSRARELFTELLQVYRSKEDTISEAQVVFNLMELALLQGREEAIHDLYLHHQRLTRQLGDPVERARGCIVYLFKSLRLGRRAVKSAYDELNELLSRETMDEVLVHEANIALRIAAVRLNIPCEANRSVGNYTQWRHQFLDYLVGESSLSIHQIFKSHERGFFKGLQVQLLVDAVMKGYLSISSIPPFFMEEIRRYSAKAKSLHYSMISAKANFSTHQANSVRRVLDLFKCSLTEEMNGQFLDKVLVEFKLIWNFCRWGLLFSQRKLPKLSNEKLPEYLVKQIKELIKDEGDMEPFVKTWFTTRGRVCEYLFMPIEGAILWFEKMDEQRYKLVESHLLLFKETFSQLFNQWNQKESPGPSRPVVEEIEPWPRDYMVGNCGAMTKLKNQILKYGKSDLAVHISGESGTGKELAARMLHDVSERNSSPFRAVNCCDFTENLIQSELFGHVKGAFTGAEKDRIGIVEHINGGTLFLDEIGDLTPYVQSMLLRFIQTKTFSRAGENKLRKVDIRLVTATNKSLKKLVKEGVFRQDLFFRVAESEIVMPPLRERGSDIKLLANHFLQQNTTDNEVKFTSSFYAQLQTHSWPGNVRELESFVKRTLAFNPDKTVIEADDMPDFIQLSSESEERTAYLETLEEYEAKVRKQFLIERLARFDGNRTKAAESMGISRQQLIRLIKKFSIEI
ncbi:MAG: hypothetical protein CSA81_09135 [Acidobacteria bacterium]|nr:MAG: hypothetical protein CSA81_09135 [Acidobacteriota bacterium]